MASDAPMGDDAGNASSTVPAVVRLAPGRAVMSSHTTAAPAAVPSVGDIVYGEF